MGFTPTASFGDCATISPATDGSGKVRAEVEIDDGDGDNTCQFLVEYAVDPYSSWTKVTLSEADSDTTATYGDPKVANADAYQVGNVASYITTSPGANKVSFVWPSRTDVPSGDGSYKLRITPYDGIFAGTAVSSLPFNLDNATPSESGATVTIDFGAAYSRDSTIDFTWSGFADSNTITTYYYSFTDNGGTETGTEASASPGQLFDASEGVVFVYVWAKDNYGNIGNAASDSIIVDTNAPDAPVIASFAYDSQSRITDICGTAEDAATVSVYDAGVYLGQTTADSNGDWCYTPDTPLSAGPHTISAIAEDEASNPSVDSYYHTVSYQDAVNIFQDTSVFKVDDISMRLEREAAYSFKFAVNADLPVTVHAYLQKNAEYGAYPDPAITLSGLGIEGTGPAAASGAGEGSWLELTVPGTPNADGVLELKVETFSIAIGARAWIDDISIAQ